MPWFESAWLSRSTLNIASTGTLGNPGVPHGPMAHGTCVRRGSGLVGVHMHVGVWAWMISRLGVGAGTGLGLGLDLHGRVGVGGGVWA